MNAGRQTTLIAGTCLALSLTACVMLLRRVDRIRPRATLEDVLYVDSPSVVRRASLGYNGLAACIYWTRAVQYFGHRHFTGADTYNQLAPLLEITTSLDPHLVAAYEYGASFLAPPPPHGAGQPDRAIRLMEYGVQHNPDDWRLYYDLGFVYYMELRDYAKASDAFARGSRVSGAHPFMKVLAAQMAEHAGDFATARMLWTATFQTSHDRDIRQNAIEHLRALRVDEDVTNLQAAVTRFGERTGRLPSSIAELAAAEHLPGVPVDPDGNPYTMSPEGRILVQNPDNFSFVTQGLPPGYKPSPVPKFHNQG
ncbi:MAG TPA: tetratricopeptide repeat protein [Candidatus Sulfotelmatobacter sp.]|nr:tetratricopeptide repeat protein [Candidatus Sulfotelmatobacter sp.]